MFIIGILTGAIGTIAALAVVVCLMEDSENKGNKQ